MNKIWELGALLAVAITVGAFAQNARPGQGPVTVELKGPLVLGFFHPFTEAEEKADDGGITEGLAHVRFALEEIAQCFGRNAATYRLDITRSITIRDGRKVRRIRIRRDSDIGIILVTPGHPVRTVFASGGPSSLGQLGPSAAAEYFGASACRRNK